jgi:hypothetical protein
VYPKASVEKKMAIREREKLMAIFFVNFNFYILVKSCDYVDLSIHGRVV